MSAGQDVVTTTVGVADGRVIVCDGTTGTIAVTAAPSDPHSREARTVQGPRPMIPVHLRNVPRLRVAALGDSVTVGVGDHDHRRNPGGWARHLSELLGAEMLCVGKNGSRGRDVAGWQLAAALDFSPHVTLISVGGNDVLRSNFNPTGLYRDLRRTIATLRAHGSAVVVMELPDIRRTAPIPGRAREVLAGRADVAVAALRKAAEDAGAHLIGLRSRPEIYHRDNWHFDRMHPGPRGHRLLAELALERLALPPRQEVPLPDRNNWSWHRQAGWMLRHGTPWFLRRSIDLLPALVWLILFARTPTFEADAVGEAVTP